MFTGICGWLGGTVPRDGERQVLSRMAGAMARDSTRDPQIAALGGGGLAAVGDGTPVSLYARDGLAAAVVGWPCWRSDDLQSIASRDGNGAALAAAYARY